MLSNIEFGIASWSHFFGIQYNSLYNNSLITIAPKEFFDSLLYAIREVNIETVHEVLSRAKSLGYSLNAHDPKNKLTPLHYAIVKCNMNNIDKMMTIIELLHSHGIELNKNSCDTLTYSPLHSATRRALPPVVHYLLKHGANPLAQDSIGKTPLDYVYQAIKKSEQENNNQHYEHYKRFTEIEHAINKKLKKLNITSDQPMNQKR